MGLSDTVVRLRKKFGNKREFFSLIIREFNWDVFNITYSNLGLLANFLVTIKINLNDLFSNNIFLFKFCTAPIICQNAQ